MPMTINQDVSQTGMQMLHPGSRKLFRYWESIRAERPCPERSDINLRQIVEIMPNMVILEMNQLQTQWVYRLAGTEVCVLTNGGKTGQDALADWDNFEREVVSKAFAISQDRKQPCLVRMRFVFDKAPILAAELIILPVFDAKTQQTQLIGGLFPLLNGKQLLTSALVRRELVSARMIWTEHEAGDALMAQIGLTAKPYLRLIQGGLPPN
jgi:hypothetical protein